MTWWKRGPDQPPKSLGKSLPRQIQDWIDGQPYNGRGREIAWHVSGLAYLCPRAQALKVLMKDHMTEQSVFTAKELVRFDVGTAVHWWWQNCYLGPMQKLLGRWACVGCNEIIGGKMPVNPHGCGVKHPRGPGGTYWEYLETVVRYQEQHWQLPIVGHCDGEIEDVPPEGETDPIGLFEFKTSNANNLPVMEISPEYMFQLQSYMAFRGRKWAKIVYFNPDGLFYNKFDPGMKLPAQEIVVKYDDSFRIRAIEKVNACEAALVEFQKIRQGSEKFQGWPEKICPNRSCSTAKRCGVVDPCFDAVAMERMAIRLKEGRDAVTGVART